MLELMAKLWQRFTYVVIDTPPVNAVTDASIVAASASATILIVEHGRTTWQALGHAKQMLDRVNAKTIGVVVNKVRVKGGAYYYSYGNYGPQSTNGRGPQDASAAGPARTNRSGKRSPDRV
jgi:Mrp family chromosome partitioning ATPase